MQIELTNSSQQIVEKMLANGRFSSVEEIVESALLAFQCEALKNEALNEKLRDADQSHQAGESVPLDMQDIKTELQQRLNDRQNAC